jgi:hypothetical protein
MVYLLEFISVRHTYKNKRTAGGSRKMRRCNPIRLLCLTHCSGLCRCVLLALCRQSLRQLRCEAVETRYVCGVACRGADRRQSYLRTSVCAFAAESVPLWLLRVEQHSCQGATIACKRHTMCRLECTQTGIGGVDTAAAASLSACCSSY